MTPAVFAKHMHAAAGDIKNIERKIALAAGLTVKTAVQRTLNSAAPRGRLNVGKRGAKIGVRFEPRGPRSVRVFMTGPVQLIESDTKAHRIPRDKVGRGRNQRANKKIVVIPGVGPKAYVNHPGTQGKHPWLKGLAVAEPALTRVAGQVYFDQFKKHLK